MNYIKERAEYKPRNSMRNEYSESFEKNSFESGISREQFVEIISRVNPKLQNSAALIFDRFDEDKSGSLDFRELTICISIMCKGDFDEKLKVCFDAYDEDKSGFLQPNEMEILITSLIKPYVQIDERAEADGLNIEEIKNRIKMICEKSGDILCFKDFLYAVKSDPALFALFSDHFMVRFEGIQQIDQGRKKSKRRDSSGNAMCNKCLLL